MRLNRCSAYVSCQGFDTPFWTINQARFRNLRSRFASDLAWLIAPSCPAPSFILFCLKPERRLYAFAGGVVRLPGLSSRPRIRSRPSPESFQRSNTSTPTCSSPKRARTVFFQPLATDGHAHMPYSATCRSMLSTKPPSPAT
jgi:hypothetical protein